MDRCYAVAISRWSLVVGLMDSYRFERLRVYQNAMVLVELIYKVTKQLPMDEKFALSDQLKRSSTSIVLNIAEGTGVWEILNLRAF